MVHNLWRSAHFLLATVAAIFLLLATLSGIVLSLEPLFLKYTSHHVNLKQVSLAEVLPKLQQEYDEILTLEVDPHERVMLSTFSMDEDLPGDFYIHPKTGKRCAEIEEQHPVFEWTTNFHRSLFLKTPGRIVIGITAFLLLLIAFTGFALLIKRLGWLRFFHPFIKTDAPSYYHTYLGRLHVVPIVLIALSGVVLSMARFNMLPETTVSSEPKDRISESETMHVSQIPIFQKTSLAELTSLEFPFSTDPEDPYILTTSKGVFEINQYHGTVLRQELYPFTKALETLSFSIHTGAGSYWWGIILLSASISMLYFMYSGAILSYQRLAGRFKNAITPENAEIVVLVGSEHGKTQRFANAFTKALLQKSQPTFKTHLNDMGFYPKMKQLVVFTATYGDGEAPANARYFLQRLPQYIPEQSVGFAVVGFGSRLYPKFCQYAKDVQHALTELPEFTPLLDPEYVDAANHEQLTQWVRNWGVKNNVQLNVKVVENQQKPQKELSLEVLEKNIAHDRTTETFMLTLKAPNKPVIQSGDLLGIIAEPAAAPRQYSVGKDNKGNLLLAIRRHEQGLCSNFLFRQKAGQRIHAFALSNPAFHIPRNGKVICIANGTGIGPFLGMFQEKSKATKELLWGVRKKAVYQLFSRNIEKAISQKKLRNAYIAYSKELEGEKYVQNILEKQPDYYAQQLSKGAVFMICGSLTMRDGVLAVLERIAQQHLPKPLSYYQNRGQILTDCY